MFNKVRKFFEKNSESLAMTASMLTGTDYHYYAD